MHDFRRSECATQMVVLHFDSNQTNRTNLTNHTAVLNSIRSTETQRRSETSVRTMAARGLWMIS